MGHDFVVRHEAEVPATPEEVWAAIATGPGIDSWFMGRNEVVGGEGGFVRTAFGQYTPQLPITGWHPGRRLAYGETPAPDGRFVAYEFLVEGRDGGSTVVRAVTSGFLPGDDWEDEFEAMAYGLELFFATLVQYTTHFAGRVAAPVTVFGPPITDWDEAWAILHDALGLTEPVRVGDPTGGLLDGAVYHVNRHTLGVRDEAGLYRFVRGVGGSMTAAHHLFGDADPVAAEHRWAGWLARTYS